MPYKSYKNLFIEDGNSSFEKVVGIDYVVDKKLYNKDIHTYDWAAENGHLEVLKWLCQNKIKGYTKYIINTAAFYGHIKIVKWLHENKQECRTTGAINYAASNGHFEIVKW